MPEIIPNHVPSPRTLLAWDGTAYRPITIDAAGNLQIDVLTSSLPAGAAILGQQIVMSTVLGQIADLRHALQSVATDRLLVRGEDQLFSFKGVLANTRNAAISVANGYVDSQPVPANTIWCMTNFKAFNNTSPTTAHIYELNHDGARYGFGDEVAAFAAGGPSYWSGFLWLDPSDTIRVYFIGGLVGDTCYVVLTGYIMTLEV